MNWRSFFIGHVSAWACCFLLLIAVVFYKIWTRPHERWGGGQRATSPCGHYEAVAMNMCVQTVSGSVREYYALSVTDRGNGMEICRYEFPTEENPVHFRSEASTKVGKLIHWDPASEYVRFGRPEQTLWSYTLTVDSTNKQTPPQ